MVGIKSQPLFELVPRSMLLVLSDGFHALVRKMLFSFERLEDSNDNLTLIPICPMTFSSIEIVLVKACLRGCTTTFL